MAEAKAGKKEVKALLDVLWKLSLICMAVTVIIFYVVGDALHFGREKVLPGPPIFSVPEIVDRMGYHGTNVAWRDEDGTWWFRRDGEVVKLSPRPKKEEH